MCVFMKKNLFVCIVFLFFPCFVFAEEVTQFTVDMHINTDATIDVVEEIHYDFGSENRHGIYRDIPVKYKTAKNNNRSIQIRNIAVVDMDDNPYTYEVLTEGKNKRIKIGDAHRYVTGEKVYVLSYTVFGAMNYFDTHDELYWNAIGDRWNVPIANATIHVDAPHISRSACYCGSYGATDACDAVTPDGDTRVTISHTDISLGNNVTIVIGMPAGTVYKPTTFEKIMAFVKDNWLAFFPFVTVIIMIFVWFLYGKDPEGHGTIVPQYAPPDDVSPAEVGMIARDWLKKEHVSALIIDLAVRGYLKITRIEKKSMLSSVDYMFTKTEKNPSDIPLSDEKILYDKLFTKYTVSDTVHMSRLKDTFHTDLDAIMKSIRERVTHMGVYTQNPKSVRAAFFAVGASIIFITMIFPFSGMFMLAAVISGIIIIVFGLIMPKRTKKGSVMREKILGLKLYLETAEKDRIDFHNAPEKNPQKFEELLPYAIALGVEDQWAKQFEGIYEGNPTWYDGGGTTFTPTVLAHDMYNISHATAQTMASTPSKAGSGGSGFSGGGGGGGFGGGGGGSW